MNWFTIWTIAGWSALGLIVLGIAVLLFSMWRDTKAQEARNIAAPALNAGPATDQGPLFSDAKEKTSKSAPTSRRALRNTPAVVVEDTSEGSLWSDVESDFSLTEGRD